MKWNKIIISLWLIGASLSACSDSFLDEDHNPNSLSPQTFWKDQSDILKGLTGTYGYLRSFAGWAASYERYFVIDNYRSDEMVFRPDVSEWDNIASFVNESTNATTVTEWTYLYKGINQANQCIDNIPLVPGDSQELDQIKRSAVAEARFLRAYFYYRLYLNYGEKIPIYTKELEQTDEEFYPDQAQPGELVKLIESELLAVQEDLPEDYPAEFKGRATKYAAAAILGRFYMFRHEMSKAEAQLSKLIGHFELVDNYEDNFDGLHKNNAESVFEIQYSGDRSGGRRAYNNIAEHLLSSNAGGYEESYPSSWLFNVLRNDKTVDGKYSQRLYGTILFDDPLTTAWYIKEGEHFSDYDSPDKIYWKKFSSWDPSLSSEYWISAFNIPIVRYADVLLLYAECLNDRGNSAEAVQYINQVRRRANVPELPETMSKDEVLKHLQDVERPCELAFEGCRWYDLLRWGIVKQALTDHGKRFAENFIETKHTLFPIPHDEFLMNPDWEQNPNFSK